MSRRGNANFARQAQQPVIKDAVYRECAYKEWVTHQFNKVDVTAWGDQKPEPKVTAQMQHFAPPKAYFNFFAVAHCLSLFYKKNTMRS